MGIYKLIVDLENQNKSYVLATVIETSGSVPGKVGFKLLVTDDEEVHGTVGGGALEQSVIKEALTRLREGRSGRAEYVLSPDKKQDDKQPDVKQIAMNCEGKSTIFYDVFRRRPAVYVFGGGHVGSSLLYFLKPLNYYVRLIDNRSEMTGDNRLINAQEVIHSDYLEYAETFVPETDSYIVILTQGHRFDYDILKSIYKRELGVRYIGIIASKSKAFAMIKDLKSDFGEDVDMSCISTPVGLRIGGNTATEIALSIAAEIQSVRFDKILIPE